MYLKIILLSFFALSLGSEIKQENNVLVLTKDNFDEAVKNKNVLVEFYAPWCGHCKQLEPEYAKAATILHEEKSDLYLGKVDATIETELAEQYQIKGYPTIKFFYDGKVVEYSGERKAQGIVNWLKKKTGPPATDLTTVNDAKAFIDKNEIAVIGFFKNQDGPEAKTFKDVAFHMESYDFGITSKDEVYAEFKATKDGVILFKKFDEGRNDYEGEIVEEDLKKFVSANSLPLVVEFSSETARQIFGGDVKTHNLLFISKKHPEYDVKFEAFRTAAKEFKNKVLFVTIDHDVEDHNNIIDFFGLEKEKLPDMRIIKLEEDIIKYAPPQGFVMDVDGIKAFVNGVLEGKISQHMLSQEVPEDWDKEPVKVLVAKNFDEIAFDKSKNVLVEFYAPWCTHCKHLAPIYDELAVKYKDTSDLVIAKMDATANELPHTRIKNFPTIKLYKKDTNEVVNFNGERTLEALGKFVDSGGVDGAEVKEKEEDEEEEKDDEQAKRDEL